MLYIQDGITSQHTDYLKTFFYQTCNGNLVPRTIMLDLEPRVINGIMVNMLFDLELGIQGSF